VQLTKMRTLAGNSIHVGLLRRLLEPLCGWLTGSSSGAPTGSRRGRKNR
jgi:hypothetical protein